MASITSYYVLKRDKHVLECLAEPLCKSMSAIKEIDMKRKAKKTQARRQNHTKAWNQETEPAEARWQNAEQLLFLKPAPELSHLEADGKPSWGVLSWPPGTVELSLPLNGSVGWFQGLGENAFECMCVCVCFLAAAEITHFSLLLLHMWAWIKGWSANL